MTTIRVKTKNLKTKIIKIHNSGFYSEILFYFLWRVMEKLLEIYLNKNFQLPEID